MPSVSPPGTPTAAAAAATLLKPLATQQLEDVTGVDRILYFRFNLLDGEFD